MPALATLILSGILAAIKAAQSEQVQEVIKAGKAYIDSLVAAKVFTVQEQAALHDYVDANAKLAAAGIKPPAWTVEPDPE